MSMEGVTLYHGDCLEIMCGMADKSVDAVITDPPYGIDYVHAGGRSNINGFHKLIYNCDWDKERPSKEYFDEILRIAKTVIIWGGNYFTDYLPPQMGWLIWDKGQRDFSLADCEMAWTSEDKATRVFDYARSKALQDGKVHPTQKPIELIKWCIELRTKQHETILDCFMGSGTTGVACMQMGRRFIGAEINKEYFDIAQRRIENTQRPCQ